MADPVARTNIQNLLDDFYAFSDSYIDDISISKARQISQAVGLIKDQNRLRQAPGQVYIIYVLAALTLAVESQYQCMFSKQMVGTGDFSVIHAGNFYYPTGPSPTIKIDYDKGLVLFTPAYPIFRTSVLMQDLGNNVMYRFPYQKDRSLGPCTRMTLTDDYKFPKGLPAGLIKKQLDVNANIRYYSQGSSPLRYDYVMHKDDFCKPVWLRDRLVSQNNMTRYFEVLVKTYTLEADNGKTFSYDTTKCTSAELSSLFDNP